MAVPVWTRASTELQPAAHTPQTGDCSSAPAPAHTITATAPCLDACPDSAAQADLHETLASLLLGSPGKPAGVMQVGAAWK